MGQQDFVQTWWPSAQRVAAQTGFRPELVLATWALDTGWGAAQEMMDCHALLGIVCYRSDIPCGLHGSDQDMLCFSSWDQFMSVYTDVLNESRYDAVRAQGTLDGQAKALATQTGFATDPAYYDKLAGVLAAIGSPIGDAGGSPSLRGPLIALGVIFGIMTVFA